MAQRDPIETLELFAIIVAAITGCVIAAYFL